jgi:hypothetical protein
LFPILDSVEEEVVKSDEGKGGDSTDPKENLPLANDSPRMLSISYVSHLLLVEVAAVFPNVCFEQQPGSPANG